MVRKRIASRRSIAAIFGEGTVLPDGTASLIRPAFAAFIRIPCSRERQSHVVGPDGDPADERVLVTPPGRNGCEPCAQAPHPAPLQSALEKRPS